MKVVLASALWVTPAFVEGFVSWCITVAAIKYVEDGHTIGGIADSATVEAGG